MALQQSITNCSNKLLKNAIPTLNLPQPLDDSLLEEFPLQSEEKGKSQVLKVFQDITNSKNAQWKENILSTSAEYSFVPLPSTSQAPQGLTFEKTLDLHTYAEEVPAESLHKK